MKRACIYARVSSKEQKEEGHSLETQTERMLNFASEHGYLVPDECVFQENIPGEYEHRPKLAKVFLLCEEGKIDAVIVDNWDRLARDTDLLGYFKTVIQRHHGVKVLCASESDPEDQSIAAKASRGVMGVVAQIENEMHRERSIRGRRQRAKGGKIIGGFKLYGYSYDKETGLRDEDPETAPVVRMIFRWLASGMSLTKIGAGLVDAGIPAPRGGKRWHTSTLARIVRRKEYIGKTVAWRWKRVKRNGKSVLTERPREEWIEQPNATPALIPEELFWQAQKQLRRNAKLARRGLKQKYLLRGHVRCRCGAAMHGRGSTKRKERYYQCWRATTKAEVDRCCDSKMIRADKLEPLVWEEIKKVLLNPQLILAEAEERIQSNNPKSIDKEIEVIEKKLAELDLEERRLIRLYGKHIVTEKTLADEVDRVKTERGSWVEELRTLEARKRAWLAMKKQALTLEDYCR